MKVRTGLKSGVSAKTRESPLAWVLDLSSSQQEVLKWLAIISMLSDHINQILLEWQLPPLSNFGRLAFPLFAFLIAYNIVKRGVAPQRYLLPLLGVGLLSQPIHIWAFNRSELNILFTLLLGVLYVLLVRWLQKRGVPLCAAHILAVLLLVVPSSYVSYKFFGPFLIPLLAAFLKSPSPIAAPFLGIYLMLTNQLAPISIYTLLLVPALLAIHYVPFALPRSSKWVFYGFYPLHLLVLKALYVAL